MDRDRFDALTRSLSAAATRRGLGRVLAGSGLGALYSSPLGALNVDAKKKRHKKNKKKKKQKTPQPVLNQFGCLDIGQPCRGDSNNCCSGICEGVSPNKGRQDTSACVAHNIGGCTAERSFCVTGNQSSLCGPQALCLATTGNASFCADLTSFSQEANCRPCGKDQDCAAAGFGPGSACVLINQGFCATPESTCAGMNGSGTACLPPGA